MQIDKDELLNQAKELLKDEVTQIAFQTWFSSLEIAEMNDSHIVLKASSQYCGELLQTRYADLILNTFKFITNREWTFSVISEENSQAVEERTIVSNVPNDTQDQEIEISNSNDAVRFRTEDGSISDWFEIEYDEEGNPIVNTPRGTEEANNYMKFN